jgi:hypothetical protein
VTPRPVSSRLTTRWCRTVGPKRGVGLEPLLYFYGGGPRCLPTWALFFGCHRKRGSRYYAVPLTMYFIS